MAGAKRKKPTSEGSQPTITPTVVTNEILQNRLLAGLGIKGGGRGSLTRIGDMLHRADTDKTPADALIREFQHSQIELTKLLLKTKRNQLELAAIQRDTAAIVEQTDQARTSLQHKRRQLTQQLQVTACEREYDALAKLAATRHPVSRRVLQQELDTCRARCQETRRALQTSRAETAVRQGQFQLLMQCLLDLKQSLTEPLDVEVVDANSDAEEGRASEDAESMDVVPAGEEEELYGDL